MWPIEPDKDDVDLFFDLDNTNTRFIYEYTL